MNKYSQIAEEISNLLEEKQLSYGDSFGNAHHIFEVLYPNGIAVEQYSDMLTLTRIIDKIFRIANKKNAFGESPYRDLVGYGLLAVERDERNARAKVEEVPF